MHDVIVVGAGPSGSSAARRCAQLGLDTLLIDKQIFPRDKTCGGALSAEGISHLDFDLPDHLIERDVYGARIHYGPSCIEVKRPHRVAVTVSRADFDTYLLQQAKAAGATVRQGVRVAGIERNSHGMLVTAGDERFSGRLVIGSDGFNSVVARHVRRKHARHEYAVCMEARLPADDADVDAYIRQAVDIHFGGVPGGYGWVFPHRGHFSVGIGGLAHQLKNPREALHEFLRSAGFSTDVEARGWPVPAGGVRRRLVTDRVLLTGDAAGFVDTFLGEGLAYAIRSGQLAGEVAAEALTAGDCSARGLQRYVRRARRGFGDDLWYSLLFARLVHRFPAFLKLLASNGRVLDKFLGIPCQQLTYRGFLTWLLARSPLLLTRYAVSRERGVPPGDA